MISLLGAAMLGCAGPALPEGVRILELEDPLSHWDDYHEVVPPVHVPQPSAGPAQVVVQLRVEPEGRIGMVDTVGGRAVPSWPPGTIADRVEKRGDRVVDVRGTRIDADGRRWHHVYKPTHADPAAPLLGAEWPAGDAAAAAAAVDAFLDALRAAPLVQATADPEAHLRGVRSKLDCDGCHVPLRPDNGTVQEHGLVSRGTDAAGWFTPATVLAADTPLEPYGAYDPNLADPFVHIRCENGPATLPEAGAGHARCPGGRVARAELDWAAALAAADEHALGACASWHHLVARLDEPERAAADHPCRGVSP